MLPIAWTDVVSGESLAKANDLPGRSRLSPCRGYEFFPHEGNEPDEERNRDEHRDPNLKAVRKCGRRRVKKDTPPSGEDMPPRSENALYHGRAPRAQRCRTWSCSSPRAASDPLKGPGAIVLLTGMFTTATGNIAELAATAFVALLVDLPVDSNSRIQRRTV